ncbi:hypothetical protein FRC08_005330 [Ceratobasidium sp. 394]|nr:hypothetical protein FRC08_005330 [Ceratobasidium sp. 394]
MAAPFVAGSAALLLQIRGKTEAAAKAMQNIFQNTAAPVPGSGASGNLLEPASHQGAGLIRVYDAMKIKGSMFPSELLLNDTANYRGSHEVSIRNDGNQTVTYTLSHSPAGTAPTININGNKNILGPEVKLIASSISVSISPSSVTVSPGQSLPVKVDIQAPTGVDPKQFPVFSGFIEAKGSDGTTLRSTYLGVAAPLRDMQIINTAQTPIIKDKNNQAISPNATFTLNDTDFPRIEYRLTAGTPRLLLDIIHPLPEASIEPRRLFRFARGPPAQLPKRPTWYGFSAAKRANPEDTFAGLDIVGRIFQKEYVSRHLEFGRNVGSASNIQQFANGTAIPDGAYQILLRALKIAGDPTKEDDWESWTSPVITVKRNP